MLAVEGILTTPLFRIKLFNGVISPTGWLKLIFAGEAKIKSNAPLIEPAKLRSPLFACRLVRAVKVSGCEKMRLLAVILPPICTAPVPFCSKTPAAVIGAVGATTRRPVFDTVMLPVVEMGACKFIFVPVKLNESLFIGVSKFILFVLSTDTSRAENTAVCETLLVSVVSEALITIFPKRVTLPMLLFKKIFPPVIFKLLASAKLPFKNPFKVTFPPIVAPETSMLVSG